MPRFMTIFAIAACYFIFAILLNSVGTVILQSINSFDISKPIASSLEGFKDLSIAFVSFAIAAFVPRVGYKLAMMAALILVAAVCALTPLFADFMMIQILFACIGTAFALIKVSVYSIVGQLSDDTKSHASLLNTIEGIFMLGVLSGYWLFSGFIDAEAPHSLRWMEVYYWLAGFTVLTALAVLFSPIKKAPKAELTRPLIDDFMEMIKLTYRPLVLVFVLSIFFYVLIEQGIGTWLPTFNNEILHLPLDVSIQITSIFAAAIAIGRLLAGQVLRFMNWYKFLNICLIFMAILMLLCLPMANAVQNAGQISTISSVFDAPLAAYLLPLVGILMAPIYPVINSVMLSSLEKALHAPMTGLIVVFSALGGTTGSIITGIVFESFGGQRAFYLSLIPMALIAITLFLFKRSTGRISPFSSRDIEEAA
ncbi:MFS transporter [Aliiglaciecola sp. 2_MG-2023]|uniref:MFS transporter n=1 Tax=unclassified Aliiglaciecola TaxID=2593648 RepID=UPI0026E21147|nr:MULTISPECIES: MFS transporter [unclassified Aliiglaciecola]MDO6712960.1 MFS transporter [Aliiglaciecola sp. 2_MG-2023]MDO6753999.1 MFS transporter [Aliiglaciecola sp. 1_MG-2023]